MRLILGCCLNFHWCVTRYRIKLALNFECVPFFWAPHHTTPSILTVRWRHAAEIWSVKCRCRWGMSLPGLESNSTPVFYSCSFPFMPTRSRGLGRGSSEDGRTTGWHEREIYVCCIRQWCFGVVGDRSQSVLTNPTVLDDCLRLFTSTLFFSTLLCTWQAARWGWHRWVSFLTVFGWPVGDTRDWREEREYGQYVFSRLPSWESLGAGCVPLWRWSSFCASLSLCRVSGRCFLPPLLQV